MAQKKPQTAAAERGPATPAPTDDPRVTTGSGMRSSPSLPPRARRVPSSSVAGPRPLSSVDAAAGDLPLGTLVEDRYEIEAQFSEGGVGLLYRAHDHKLGREVAVKVMRPELSQHSALRPRFEQEAGALVALGHPNIVPIHDYGHIADSPYIVMAMLRGDTLRRALDNGGPMTEERAFEVVRQLLQGLSYAHAQGVAHRDLKPSNIFLERFPNQPDVVKMLDFGFAAFLDGEDGERNDLSEQDLGFGTPAYMPPEQLRGQLARPESDVYAVGLLLFEMLAGCRPFQGDTRALMRAQLRDTLPRLSERNPQVGESEALRGLLLRATDKKPERRFADAAAMLEALQALPRPATFGTASVSGERPISRADLPLQKAEEAPADDASGEADAGHRRERLMWAAAGGVIGALFAGVVALLISL